MIFYDNYSKLKKAEIYYNNVVSKSINLETVNDFNNMFMRSFAECIAAYDEILKILVSNNTQKDVITSYASISDESAAGKKIIEFILSNFKKENFVNKNAELSINESLKELQFNLDNHHITINLSNNKITTKTISSKSEKHITTYLVKINNEEFLFEKSVIKTFAPIRYVERKGTLVNTATRKVVYSQSTIKKENLTQKRMLFNENKHAFLIEKKNMHLKGFEVKPPQEVISSVNINFNTEKIRKLSNLERKQVQAKAKIFGNAVNSLLQNETNTISLSKTDF